MALKKLPGAKPKAAVKLPGSKAPNVKSAASRTTQLLGKGRKPAAPKVARPQRLPMAPQQQQQQPDPTQGWAGVMPGQLQQ